MPVARSTRGTGIPNNIEQVFSNSGALFFIVGASIICLVSDHSTVSVPLLAFKAIIRSTKYSLLPNLKSDPSKFSAPVLILQAIVGRFTLKPLIFKLSFGTLEP
jgi:hypothetical protein